MPPLEAILQQQANQFMPQIPEGEVLLKQHLQMQDQLKNEATYGATGPMPALNPVDPTGDIERAAREIEASQYGALPGFGGLGPNQDYVAPPSKEEQAAAYGATANIPTPQMAAGPMQVSYEEFMSMDPAMQQGVYQMLPPEKQREFDERAAREPLEDDYQGGPSAEELFQQGYDEAANDPMRNQVLRSNIEQSQKNEQVQQRRVDDVKRGNDHLQERLDALNSGAPVNPYTGRVHRGLNPELQGQVEQMQEDGTWYRPGQRADQVMEDIASRDVHPMNEGYSPDENKAREAAVQRALARGDWRTALRWDRKNK